MRIRRAMCARPKNNLRRIIEQLPDRSRVGRLALLVAVLSVAVYGCGSSRETIWSAKVVSPNGVWIANARTDAWSGPGVGTAASSVCLARTAEPRDCTDVISYMESATNLRPQITWGSDNELVVRIPDPSKVDLQTVKFADIRITLKALPTSASAAVH